MPKHNPERCISCKKRIERINATGRCRACLAELRAAEYSCIETAFRKPGGAATALGITRYLLSEIIAHTSDVFGVRIEDVIGHRRTHNLVQPRQCISLIAKLLCPNLSYPQIGVGIARDHSTVMYNAGIGERLFTQDLDFQNKVLAVVVRMKPVSPHRASNVVKSAPRVSKPTPKPQTKPKNDFRPAENDEPDRAHLYQNQIAQGSARLLQAIRAARA